MKRYETDGSRVVCCFREWRARVEHHRNKCESKVSIRVLSDHGRDRVCPGSRGSDTSAKVYCLLENKDNLNMNCRERVSVTGQTCTKRQVFCSSLLST